jgi:signal transduction histidine kinase
MGKTPQKGRCYLRAAGVSAWVLAGAPALWRILRGNVTSQPVTLTGSAFLLWAGAWLIFILSFWLSSGGVGDERHHYRNRVLLLAETAAALFMFHLVCTGLETTLLAVVAAQLGVYFRLSAGLLWLVAQTAALFWLRAQPSGGYASWAWIWCSLPFEGLALFTSYFAASEFEARCDLSRANAELHATRELLAESRRMAERARISREMHDLLGHHLTALSLNLEIARHHADGDPRSRIEKCQDLAKRLLDDLREVVGALRNEDSVDLPRILRPLTADIPRPQIHLNVPDNLKIQDPERAHALIRCIQEIITNAVKHARAENLWIEIVTGDHTLEVQARDDGQGADRIQEGQGLAGMRQRLEELGGRLDVQTWPKRGFRLTAVMPLPGVRS